MAEHSFEAARRTGVPEETENGVVAEKGGIDENGVDTLLVEAEAILSELFCLRRLLLF